MTGITEIKINGSPSEPTLSSVTLRPIRKRSSAMKRLMQRFLWMVFLSLCRPRKKQNVKMHMAKQTSETTMPTRVMTVSSSLCSLPGPWRKTGWRERTYREERWIKCFAKAMRDHVCHNHLFQLPKSYKHSLYCIYSTNKMRVRITGPLIPSDPILPAFPDEP